MGPKHSTALLRAIQLDNRELSPLLLHISEDRKSMFPYKREKILSQAREPAIVLILQVGQDPDHPRAVRPQSTFAWIVIIFLWPVATKILIKLSRCPWQVHYVNHAEDTLVVADWINFDLAVPQPPFPTLFLGVYATNVHLVCVVAIVVKA